MRAALFGPPAALACVLAWAEAEVVPPSPVAPYYRFAHAIGIGDLERALESFGDAAVVIADPVCPQERPCVGHRDIAERYLPALQVGSMARPFSVVFFDGQTVYTRGDRAPATPDDTAGRIGHRIELGGGRILRIVAEPPAPAAPFAVLQGVR